MPEGSDRLADGGEATPGAALARLELGPGVPAPLQRAAAAALAWVVALDREAATQIGSGPPPRGLTPPR